MRYDRFARALARFLEAELVAKLPGWRKWTAGAAVALVLEDGDRLLSLVKDNPVVIATGVIGEDGDIDVDRLYRAFLAQAEKGAATFEFPGAGTVTVTKKDLEKLRAYLEEEE